MTMGGAATTGQYIRAGKMKALAIGRPERLKEFPDVPTLSEIGLGYADPKTWFGLFAPAGTPSGIVSKIQTDVAGVMKDPEFIERYIDSRGIYTSGRQLRSIQSFHRSRSSGEKRDDRIGRHQTRIRCIKPTAEPAPVIAAEPSCFGLAPKGVN
jgi:Tripartite tricarboxylate transporter family receptor